MIPTFDLSTTDHMSFISPVKSKVSLLSKISSAMLLSTVVFTSQSSYGQHAHDTGIINIVFTSDAHFGISRLNFRGKHNVSADTVNAAMISQINSLPSFVLPVDAGVKTGEKVQAIDYLVEGGDICNRMNPPVQTAATSWMQFKKEYIGHLTTKGKNGKPTRLLLDAGNHDISNAIGYPKLMKPATDPSSMVNIYNMMLKPKQLMTTTAYRYQTDKIHYSLDVQGIHLMFVNLWPDSAERIWMKKDLKNVAASTPVIIFTHDQPECQAEHFTNPNPPYLINAQYKFENLTEERYKDINTAAGDEWPTDIEQRGWVAFLKQHPNIKAYFHGNSNWNQFYNYQGPDKDVSLNVFRVDSPMKGKFSAKDETLLSFQLLSIDTKSQLLTVRECLWNTNPLNAKQQVVAGQSITVSLKVQ